MRLVDHTCLDPMALEALRLELKSLGMLSDVVQWSVRSDVPVAIVDVVIQDEFTHDVIVSHGDRYLVFDTT